jgi:diaminopimelate epimerase
MAVFEGEFKTPSPAQHNTKSRLADNLRMHIRFTKMQGAGNDFVVLDETRQRLHLSPAQYRWLADRHFGIGADQILSVRAAPSPDVDFEYVIHNADGGEVEHCGNGARCFVRFVRDQGLTTRSTVRVKVHGGIISLHERADGLVSVDMGAPTWDAPRIPFNPQHAQALPADAQHLMDRWRIQWPGHSADITAVSMGNPHAVLWVDDVDTAPVLTWGPVIEHHPAFPKRVNVGFAQRISRREIRLRVFERGAGETLACGTGACAAVVAGQALGWLDAEVVVQARGGTLEISWAGGDAPVRMTGPATTVFHGETELPDIA